MTKRYEDLNKEDQEKAVAFFLNRLLSAVCEGHIRFNDDLNKDRLQKRIDKAIALAEKKGTPWFASEYVMDAVGDELRGMAECDAEDTEYTEGPTVCMEDIRRSK